MTAAAAAAAAAPVVVSVDKDCSFSILLRLLL